MKLCRQLHEAAVPCAVANAVASQARHFARWKEDQHAALLELRFHLQQRGFTRASAQVIDGNKQRAERLKMTQHPVGNDFDISPHAGDGMKQGEAVEGAGRMVGDNDEWAMLGDLLKVVGGEGAADAKVLKDLLNHIQPLQVAMAGGELLKFLFIEQAF